MTVLKKALSPARGTSTHPSGYGKVLLVCSLVGLTCAWMACSSQSPPPSAREAQVTLPPPRKPTSAEAPTAASGRSKETRTGLASFIAKRLDGRKTASGEIYDGSRLVAAHPTYPFGTVVRVTNQENERVVEVTIIDRNASGAGRPIIDLSRAAAEQLDFIQRGTVKVKTEVIKRGAERSPPRVHN